MQPNDRLSPLGRAYIVLVIAAGALAIASSIQDIAPAGSQGWLILAALTLISGSATVRLPSIPATLSVSETFVFTSVLLYGPAAGTLTVALDGLIISLWLSKRRKELHRVLFNMAAPAISIWIAAHLFFMLTGGQPFAEAGTPDLETFALPLVAFAIIYFSLNSWLIAFAVALETRQSAALIWRSNFVWLSLNFMCGASVAAMLTLFPGGLNPMYMAAVVPLLLVLYLTYRTSMDRVADATKHLNEMNEMYLSTIETLAMAVDAKDQVTHGHIRRVQTYAVGLARRLGVDDAAQLRAMEAASLLHDMGKLAVPEYILNKPGKLTPAEFEKMKLHASIGADILSSIHFPYPVIPIVRHHHENWDGSGYPDGLAGADIPLGARILSVVDCFDALTSDRPYRPRLSDEQALDILHQRRGTMYDPLVVDEFVKVHSEIAAAMDISQEMQNPAIAEITKALSEPLTPEGHRPATPELASQQILALASLAQEPTRAGDSLALLCLALRGLVPWEVLILWRYDNALDCLVSEEAFGPSADILLGHTCALGERLSGWVGANKQTAVNSDPALDLAPLGLPVPHLKSALVAPLLNGDALVGVLSLYSRGNAVFSRSNQATLEFMSAYFATALQVSIDTSFTHGRGREPEHLVRVQRLIDQNRSISRTDQQISVVVVSADPVRCTDMMFRRILSRIHGQLRLGDVVVSTGTFEAACFLFNADAVAALAVADRIRTSLGQSPAMADVRFSVAVATARCATESAREMVGRARQHSPTPLLVNDLAS